MSVLKGKKFLFFLREDMRKNSLWISPVADECNSMNRDCLKGEKSCRKAERLNSSQWFFMGPAGTK